MSHRNHSDIEVSAPCRATSYRASVVHKGNKRCSLSLCPRIRYFDVLILLANVIFLLLIVVKWFRARSKLNPSKPLLFSVTCLIVAITLANIFRCVFAMVFPIQAFPAQELILKVSHSDESVDRNPALCLFRFFGCWFG